MGIERSWRLHAIGVRNVLHHQERERAKRQRVERERAGFAGPEWDVLVELWNSTLGGPIDDFWEFARVGSRVADRFGDSALEAFAVQVGTPVHGVKRSVESYRNTHTETEPSLPAPYVSESLYVRDLQRRLIARGWVAKRESMQAFGRADLRASISAKGRRSCMQLIEAKLSADWRAASQALGQLLFYRGTYAGTRDIPDYGLWFACPDRPEERVLEVLDRYGVGYVA